MLGSPPPWRAAMMIARLSLLHNLPRLASIAPFLCLMVAQWEWPDMAPPYSRVGAPAVGPRPALVQQVGPQGSRSSSHSAGEPEAPSKGEPDSPLLGASGSPPFFAQTEIL